MQTTFESDNILKFIYLHAETVMSTQISRKKSEIPTFIIEFEYSKL